jgi:DNA-3-methyladenine glycosylase II
LCKTIIYQQLAGKAAKAIHTRFLASFEGDPTPQSVNEKTVLEMRAVGLSERKVGYIKSLASHFVLKTLVPAKFHQMEDQQVIQALTQVSGIGEWSAHMYLMFELHRQDIFPVGDLAVRKSLATHFKDEPEIQGEIGVLARKGKGGKKVEQALIALCERKWKPYRSLGSWYMWQHAGLKPIG